MSKSSTEIIQEELQATATVISGNSEKTGKKLYLESYGCQMNFSDSEIVASILAKAGFSTTRIVEDADVVLINTCAIRDHAEQRVHNRLAHFKSLKQAKPELTVGLLGCMAERLKSQLLNEEKLVDLIAGPDAYRDLPALIEEVESGHEAVNVLLSREETYADITPVRSDKNGISTFISIMRGCDNMCSFCVVPFTRGRERSRDPESIAREAYELFDEGYRQVTLLGQNVDSYKWSGNAAGSNGSSVNFAQLLELVANVNPLLRVRFSTSHPKDMSDDVLHAMARYENICNYIHLPIQSGNNDILEKMNRGYTREWYLERINTIRSIIPDCSISTDIITGFCSETEQQHKDTLSVMKNVKYDFAYMFKYSERPKTLAQRKYNDDIPDDVKTKRLSQIIGLQQQHSLEHNKKAVGCTHKVLIEGTSKKSDEQLFGRNTQNSVIVFPKENYKPGNYVHVQVHDCTTATLLGNATGLANLTEL